MSKDVCLNSLPAAERKKFDAIEDAEVRKKAEWLHYTMGKPVDLAIERAIEMAGLERLCRRVGNEMD